MEILPALPAWDLLHGGMIHPAGCSAICWVIIQNLLPHLHHTRSGIHLDYNIKVYTTSIAENLQNITVVWERRIMDGLPSWGYPIIKIVQYGKRARLPQDAILCKVIWIL